MLSKSANPSLVTPSQAPHGEGVETGWEPPDRVTAQVKAQSRPRTLTMWAAAKAEVAWDQESPGSSPGGATQKRWVTCGLPAASASCPKRILRTSVAKQPCRAAKMPYCPAQTARIV